jgi:hypothetical protein
MAAHRLPMLLLLIALLGLLAGRPASTARVAEARGGRAQEQPQEPQPQPQQQQQQLEEAIAYLHAYMPARDAGVLSDAFVNATARLALEARAASPWAAAVPWQLFLDYVLPYASLDEPREDWRSLFWPLLRPLVAGARTPGEAALLLNKQMWGIWGVHFRADQAPEILSPGQVIAAGYGSCSALSIMLASACRAVGVPARVAGARGRAPPARACAPPACARLGAAPACCLLLLLPLQPAPSRRRRGAAAQARRAGCCRRSRPPCASASPITTGSRCGTAQPGASWARQSGCRRASTPPGSSRSQPSSRCRAAS